MTKDDRELIEQYARAIAGACSPDENPSLIWRAHIAEAKAAIALATRLEALQAQPVGETIASIAAWCDETFGPAGAYRIAQRAKEELKELLDETPGDEWTDKARIEAADVVIILLRTPGIWAAIEEKMAINRKREWRLTGDGCGYHIPAPPALTASPPVVSEDESGWLIEMVEPDHNKSPVPRWWHPEHGWMWDANKALRFAREIDAQDYITGSGRLPGKPTEHIFLSAPGAES